MTKLRHRNKDIPCKQTARNTVQTTQNLIPIGTVSMAKENSNFWHELLAGIFALKPEIAFEITGN